MKSCRLRLDAAFAIVSLIHWGEVPAARAATPAAPVDFEREVRPIFEARCERCHGESAQKSGFRLDRREAALEGGDSGRPAIAPGKPAESRLLALVDGSDPDLTMPPKGPRLEAAEVERLRLWIEEGASWADSDTKAEAPKHWAYVKPVRRDPPAVKVETWARTPVDRFILARLEEEGLAPSPEAEPARLLRRVSLDLTGLPPSIEEAEAFLRDAEPGAYERAVDRLLASPAYGERWARVWLDLARYADSQGYEKDNPRTIWRYREWVIDALNRDLPFDRFTIEQLAGDLLPGATAEQRVATAFHRNTMTNTEGGTDDEEFRIAAVVDRVNTTGEVWLGTTLGCAQCHSHKYDPFTQKEYYRVFAFLNNTRDSDRDDEGPVLEVPTPEEEERARAIALEIAATEASLGASSSERDREAAEWETTRAAPPEILAIIDTPRADRTEAQAKALDAHWRSVAPSLEPLRRRLEELKASMPKPTTVPVLEELPEPRTTRLLVRGNFLTPGEPVEPGVPASLHPFPDGEPRNRLGLARWIVHPENPLTARVAVNRIWEQYFGCGIVETTGDFGTRGEAPTHPELLDWLALEFQAKGWSLKALHRLLVTSAVYRQSSRATPALLERDPGNRLLARGPRLRLEAEMVRDQALATSGLLARKVGGPSVMPLQPEGVWNSPYSGAAWTTSSGEDRHRRGIYTFWRRTTPYPSFLTFDAPSREICVGRRSRSNTPLQALVVLNDPVFVECAQALARRVLREAGPSDAERAAHGLRLAFVRAARPAETSRLLKLLGEERGRLEKDANAAIALAGPEPPAGLLVSELAAWCVVAGVILNLDEYLTKG